MLNYFRTGDKSAAYPPQGVVKEDKIFRKEDLKLYIYMADEIKLTMYEFEDETKVAGEIMFRSVPGDDLEGWFKWERAVDTTLWDLETRTQGGAGNFVRILQENTRVFYINNNYGGCDKDAGWFGAYITSSGQTGGDVCAYGRWWEREDLKQLGDEANKFQLPLLLYSPKPGYVPAIEQKLGGKFTISTKVPLEC